MSPLQMIRKRRLSHKRLGEILVECGQISEEQLAAAVERVSSEGKSLGEVLVAMNAVSEEAVLHAFAQQYSFPFMRLGDYDVDPDVVKIVPRDVAMEHSVFPVERFQNSLTVAFSNPLDLVALERLQALSGCSVQAFITTASEIRQMIQRHYA